MSRSTDSRAAPAVLRRITRGKITAARAALRSRAPASIHEARKRLKETRAILRLIRDEIGDRPFDLDNRRLRDAGRVLSAVRDAHVLIDTLATLLERERAKLNGESMEGVRRLLERRQRAAQAGLARAGTGRVLRSLGVAAKQTTAWPLAHRGWKAIAGGLKRTYRAGRKAMAAALADPADDNLHEWRKRAKDLRYQLETLEEMGVPKLGRETKKLKELGDLLGEDHDLAVLAGILHTESFVAATTPSERELLLGLISARRHKLSQDAKCLGGEIYNPEPREFLTYLHRRWRNRVGAIATRRPHPLRPNMV